VPTHSPMPAHTPWAPCDPALWRRLVPAFRGTLVMALMLCAVIHGMPEESHGSVPVPAGFSAMARGEHPHGPHIPHGADDCAANVIVRTAAQSTEDLPLGAMAVVVLVAVSLTGGRPLVRPGPRRRRSARTGRVALVRTSRWRI
jgi:lipoprotein LpqS